MKANQISMVEIIFRFENVLNHNIHFIHIYREPFTSRLSNTKE